MKWCHKISILMLAFSLQFLMVACSSSGEQQEFQEEFQQQGEYEDQQSAYNEEGQQEEYAQQEGQEEYDENFNNEDNEQGFEDEGFEDEEFANIGNNDLEALENEVENLDNLANNDASQDDLQAILNEVNNENQGDNLAQENSLFNNQQQANGEFGNEEGFDNLAANDVQMNDTMVDNLEGNMDMNAQMANDSEEYVDLASESNMIGDEFAGNTASMSMSAVSGNLPEMGTKMAYVVEKGDTMGVIASKIYGSAGRWKELAQNSGLADANRIYPGDLVYYQLDQDSQMFAANYENLGRASVTVAAGDTLMSIAKQVYGSSQAWKSLWRQNDAIENPESLPAGMTVYFIQAGAMSASLNNSVNSSVSYTVFAKSKKQVTKRAA